MKTIKWALCLTASLLSSTTFSLLPSGREPLPLRFRNSVSALDAVTLQRYMVQSMVVSSGVNGFFNNPRKSGNGVSTYPYSPHSFIREVSGKPQASINANRISDAIFRLSSGLRINSSAVSAEFNLIFTDYQTESKVMTERFSRQLNTAISGVFADFSTQIRSDVWYSRAPTQTYSSSHISPPNGNGNVNVSTSGNTRGDGSDWGDNTETRNVRSTTTHSYSHISPPSRDVNVSSMTEMTRQLGALRSSLIRSNSLPQQNELVIVRDIRAFVGDVNQAINTYQYHRWSTTKVLKAELLRQTEASYTRLSAMGRFNPTELKKSKDAVIADINNTFNRISIKQKNAMTAVKVRSSKKITQELKNLDKQLSEQIRVKKELQSRGLM